ncbi:hypothetical protein PV416_39785 [Streptomyces ipomoeae]|uniref:Uncharacterized protein n=1 Tax=Streptomyces ipomoeae 91-03 TaxID=698759 RepID=L1KYL7_9ACTN|nr:hypothetical protein [Streptomyces ipomoeae]EKX65585.1 hypothetical protein STRIP9103_09685 [Streptomyces ipomoeae 91-03]MDX2827045.1 hypothetical protein [Streptomyces ipomoeae]MDX2842112.1 hypothetical protein [Streptomyces ipomoeae]MDX2879707.1 hypothetical protein [Streptomyces ipomoeae]TQE33378.1 hypothetical protein Sipo7851_20835 [Streptomyces ipomoeae]
MPKNSGSRAVPENIPQSVVLSQSSTPSPAAGGEVPGLRGLTLPHVLPLIVFPMIGCVLYVVGMPVTDVFTFLAGCGGIGAAVTIAVTGGRRVLLAFAHGVLAAMGPK